MPQTKGFKELTKNVKKQYLGKKVPKQYQDKYGKVYGKEDVKSVAYAIGKHMGMRT